jgi:hypothetical protein
MNIRHMRLYLRCAGRLVLTDAFLNFCLNFKGKLSTAIFPMND